MKLRGGRARGRVEDSVQRKDLPDLGTIAAVVGHIGRPTLPETLDKALAKIVPFDLSAIFGFPFDSRPLLLHNGYQQHATTSALEAYLNGAYLFDPFYTACTRNLSSGVWRMRDLAPDEFFDSEFYSSREVHPCISMQAGSLVEEIGFLIPMEGGFSAVYSLMRSHGAPFSDKEMGELQYVEPLVRETVRTHWRDAHANEEHLRLDDLMETAFASFCEERLTYQQRRIVQYILRGNSNYAISKFLSITEGTVKLHRQNIYRRLNISSQRELFSLFVERFIPPKAP
jgi:DNA-binding CsgD family transcriptional regulator